LHGLSAADAHGRISERDAEPSEAIPYELHSRTGETIGLRPDHSAVVVESDVPGRTFADVPAGVDEQRIVVARELDLPAVMQRAEEANVLTVAQSRS